MNFNWDGDGLRRRRRCRPNGWCLCVFFVSAFYSHRQIKRTHRIALLILYMFCVWLVGWLAGCLSFLWLAFFVVDENDDEWIKHYTQYTSEREAKRERREKKTQKLMFSNAPLVTPHTTNRLASRKLQRTHHKIIIIFDFDQFGNQEQAHIWKWRKKGRKLKIKNGDTHESDE